ncbi:MAG: hypothetical protein ACR2Q4_16800 [Geminicoccaceae bacterium]
MINKILFTIFAVVAIWKAFSMLSRLSKSSGSEPARAKPAGRPAGTTSKAEAQPSPESIELVPCPRCGSYVDPKEGCRCSANGA